MSSDKRPPNRRRPLAAGATVLVAAAVVIAAALVLLRDERALRGSAGPGSPGASSSAARPAEVRPQQAPDVSGADPITGKEIRLADFRGKPVVVNIWASWCPGCNEEAADLREFAATHPEAVVLGVDFQDTVSGARSFYRRWGWRHPTVFDSAGTQTAALGLFGLPTTLFLDSRHRIVARVVGATDLAGFERGLEIAARAA